MSGSGDNAGPPRWWRLQRRLVLDPVAMAVPLRTELGQRPHTQQILRPRPVDATQKLLVGSVAVLAAVFLAVAVAERLWTLALIAGLTAVLLAVAVWVFRRRTATSWSATWHHDHVVVRDSRYGDERTWQEPLTAFTGVARRNAYLSQGNELMPGRRVHGVVLVHPDEHKSVLLHAQRQPIDDEVLTGYARRLRTRVL